MGIFETLSSSVLLMLSAYMSYRLIQGGGDLFSSSNLSRSFRTIGLLALGLCCFVGMLFYSLPDGGSAGQPASKSSIKADSARYDRSI